MQSSANRLDRFISKITHFSQSDVRYLIAQRRLVVNGDVATAIHQRIDKFTEVVLDGRVLQNVAPRYIVINKPRGYVSATQDKKHSTLVDLLSLEERQQLHIVGRLDFNSTGLVLLTNDGSWSAAINCKQNKIKKYYRVVVDKPLTQAMIDHFRQGMYFAYENIVTEPAELIVTSGYEAVVILVEGRYHQIKRMFGYFQLKVLSLHRFAVGGLGLTDDLSAGQYRHLTATEIKQVFAPADLRLDLRNCIPVVSEI